MELNYIAIIAATVAQFVVSAVWYMPIFGKVWGEMHGFDMLPPEVQKEAQQKMMPFLGLQFVMTLITTTVLALFIAGLPEMWNLYGIAGFMWLGFVMPTQVGAVVFGGTDPKWVVKKICIMSGASFLSLMTAVLVFQLF